MRFRMNPEGQELSGRGYTDIVQGMADMKLEAPSSLARYRRTTAKRVSEGFGHDIDATSDEAFVKSLEEAGLLERL